MGLLEIKLIKRELLVLPPIAERCKSVFKEVDVICLVISTSTYTLLNSDL